MNIHAAPYREPHAMTSALPLRLLGAWSLVGERRRQWLAIAAIACIACAAAAYIVAVNAMVLAGEEMRRQGVELAKLEQRHALLQSVLAERQSPAWLQVRAMNHGMVEAVSIRYLRAHEPIALAGSAR